MHESIENVIDSNPANASTARVRRYRQRRKRRLCLLTVTVQPTRRMGPPLRGEELGSRSRRNDDIEQADRLMSRKISVRRADLIITFAAIAPIYDATVFKENFSPLQTF